MTHRLLPLALLLPSVLACTGGLGDAPEKSPDIPEVPEPVLEPKSVPAAPETVVGDGFCVALEDGESFWAVSPEGHAWLARSEGGVQHIRVLDPLDQASEIADVVTLDELKQVRAWSSVDASVVTAEGLWRLEEMARVQVTPPTSLANARLCGDPGTNGSLLVDGSLFERRDDTWFVWESGEQGPAAPTALLDLDGECLGTDNVTWMMADDGWLWQLELSQVRRPQQFEPGAIGSATAAIVAVLEPSRLITGPGEWQPWVFEGDTPTVVHASGGFAWMAAGQQLLRFDGERFVEVTHAHEGAIGRVAAHPGGAWLIGEQSLCHVSTAPMLRVQGVRAYSRSKELNYPFLVTSSDNNMAAIGASIDGESIALVVDEDTGWMSGVARLDHVGWSDLVVTVDGAERHLPVKRLPEVTRSWGDDIQPIYQEHCTGGSCHGSATENVPDLSTFEAWLSYASDIRSRVVQAETMPPASARTAEWDDDQVEVIAEWLEGGMLP